MADPGGGNIGPVEPGPIFTPPPDVTPTIQLPPFVNTPIPSPSALAKAHNQAVSNTISLYGAKAGDPEPYVFGRTLAEGKVVAGDDSSGELVIDVLWSVGEIEEYEHRVFAGSREGLGTALGENEHFTGTAGQSASTIFTALLGSYDVLANKAHSVLTLNPNFQPKTLDIRMLMKGLKLTDPRTSPHTLAYSTNPALALARILVDCGYTMDWGSVGEAADYCDELVGSPGIKRWEIGGQIRNRQQLAIWVQTLAAYCHCFVDLQGSTVSLVPDKPRSSNHTVTGLTDLVEGTESLNQPGGRNVPDAVIVLFDQLQEEGDSVNLIPQSFTFGTPGGAGTVMQLPMPFVPDFARAGRHADEAYNKARNGEELTFDSFDKGIARSVGDLGAITYAPFDLSADTMYLLKNRQVAPGRWRVTYRQYAAGNYSEALYTGTTNYNPLGDPNDPPNGPIPTLSEELHTGSDGVTYSRIRILFTGVSWAYIQNYRITIVGSDGEYSQSIDPRENLGAGITHENFTSDPLTSGVTYTVSVYVRSVTDVLGAPGTAQIVSANATNAILDVGSPINMHIYILDGDAKYATTSMKTGSPAFGESWADRFGDSPEGQAWSAGETWLGDQVTLTVFETEIWDSGNQWDGQWRFSTNNFSKLGGATMAPFVSLSDDVSPLSFVDNAGASFSDEARHMKAEAQVADSPITAGQGLHVKLPIPVFFELGQ